VSGEVKKALGWAAAAVVFLGSQFWGVPYYIRYVAAQEVKTINDNASVPKEVTDLSTKVAELEGRIVPVESAVIRIDGTTIRVEGKVDELNRMFTDYLQRQAERDD